MYFKSCNSHQNFRKYIAIVYFTLLNLLLIGDAITFLTRQWWGLDPLFIISHTDDWKNFHTSTLWLYTFQKASLLPYLHMSGVRQQKTHSHSSRTSCSTPLWASKAGDRSIPERCSCIRTVNDTSTTVRDREPELYKYNPLNPVEMDPNLPSPELTPKMFMTTLTSHNVRGQCERKEIR